MRTVTIQVSDDGDIDVSNEDFQDFELRGLLLGVIDHIVARQNASSIIEAIDNTPELKKALIDLSNQAVEIVSLPPKGPEPRT